MTRLKINATRPQAQFLTLPHRYRLFCAGYGAGKSETMIQAAVIDGCQSADALVGLYAPTYDLVRLITAPRLMAKLDEHGVRATHNKAENIVYTSDPSWGDFVLRTMDNPARIVGYETFAAHADEIDTLRFDQAKEAWNKIIARNRQKPRGMDNVENRVGAYTTPEGFRFAHWRWVQQQNDEYGMIQAPSYSNPYLPDGYTDSLRATYPAALAEAYIEGKFVNLTTGTIYKEYDRERCRSAETIRDKEPLFIGQDFNVGDMASTIYVKRETGWHAVDELTGLYDTPELVRVLRERFVDAGHKVIIYPDASGAGRSTNDASSSDIALLQGAGFLVRVNKTNPRVKDRIISVNQAFASGALWVNDRACPETASCLERQAYDKNGEPDKSSGYDHQNDATGYPIVFEMPVRRPSPQVEISF